MDLLIFASAGSASIFRKIVSTIDLTRETGRESRIGISSLYIPLQDAIRAEIHGVLGRDGEVTMADKMRLPYTTAAVAELQRMANIVPLNVFHRTVTDTKVCKLENFDKLTQLSPLF